MDKISLKKGQVLHKKGDTVNSLEIVLSGALMMTDGNDVEVRLGQGAIAGAIFMPEEEYTFDHVALEDSILLVMDYESGESIVEAVTGTPTIAPAMAVASMELASSLLESVITNDGSAATLCKDLKYNYNNYGFLCVKLEKEPEQFEFVEELEAPEPSQMTAGWEANICRAYRDHQEDLKSNFYALDTSFCVTTVMQASEIGWKFLKDLETVSDFISDTKEGSADFVQEYFDVRSRADTQDSEDSGEVPVISNAIDVILSFSGVDSTVADPFRKAIKQYIAVPDRREKSDEMRALRLAISNGFYEIYEAAFFKSMEESTIHIPVEVCMFFLFGFVDEKLAGEANTATLYKLAVGWENDPEDHIMSMYDWLTKIYMGNAVPSKDDFNNDWRTYLRNQVQTYAITQKQADALLVNHVEMVRFEIKNMFMKCNRITTGRLASFVPVFSATDVIKPLDKCFATPNAIRAAIDKVTDIDYSCFYRPARAHYPEYNVPNFTYDMEVKPYFIIMPNIGERGSMWQEIEGVDRLTPAHMMISVFHGGELEDTITRMCGEFRWEMCRRIQGIRYADIIEKSLTSEFMNYLQFYKKNGSLTNDMKENIKMALQKARNDYKGVFIADYAKYIQYEVAGQIRLNKVSREIVFKYCPLSKKYREAMATSHQYSPLIERWRQNQGGKIHTLDLLEQRIKRMKPNAIIPEPVEMEIKFCQL